MSALSVVICPSPQTINAAMQKDTEELNIGVLDIYGFEIFQVKFSQHAVGMDMYMCEYAGMRTCAHLCKEVFLALQKQLCAGCVI